MRVVGIGEHIGYIGSALYHPSQCYNSASLSTVTIATTGDKNINEMQMLEEIRYAILKTLHHQL